MNLFPPQAAAGIRHPRSAAVPARRRPVRRVQGGVRPDAGVRLRPAGRRGRSASWPTSASAAGRPRGRCSTAACIYVDSADKAARFIMDCNQTRVPILFLQDVNGFMVGRDSEQAGIIRAGAKLVNVIANSVVPKITVILGGSFGAGNYALCGKAFDPRFIFAWPTARYAVMGGEQAASTLLDITVAALRAAGHEPDAAGAGGAAPQGGGELRGADRRALRGGAAVGGRNPRSGGDAVGAADGAGGGHAVRRRPAVPDGGAAGIVTLASVPTSFTSFGDQRPRFLRGNTARNRPCSEYGCE